MFASKFIYVNGGLFSWKVNEGIYNSFGKQNALL